MGHRQPAPGRPARYREIFALNHGRQQPDAQTLTEASLIRPGWILLLPADARGPGLEAVPGLSTEPVHHYGTATNAPPGHEQPAEEPRTDRPRTDRPRTDQPRVHEPRVNEQPGVVAGIPGRGAGAIPPQPPTRRFAERLAPSAPAAPEPDRAPPPPAVAGGDELSAPAAVTVGLGIGALAGVAALVRARRAAQRCRPAGTRPAPVPPPLPQVEAGLRADARRAAPVADAVRLAVAIGAQLSDHQVRVVGAVHEPDAAVLLLVDPPQPAPVPFDGDPQGWRLPPDQRSFAFGIEDQADPQPARAPIGNTHAGQVFYDLEPAGLISIDGPEADVDDLIATVCAALVGAPWTGLQLYGPPELIARVGPVEHVTAVADLPDQLSTLRPTARGNGELLLVVQRA